MVKKLAYLYMALGIEGVYALIMGCYTSYKGCKSISNLWFFLSIILILAAFICFFEVIFSS